MEEENRQETITQENKGLSIAAMVLGIISVVLFCLWYISLPCAILAIIFGVIEKKKNKNNKFAKSGFILGIVSLVITVIFLLVIFSISVRMSGSLFERAQKVTEQTIEEQIEEELELQNRIRNNNIDDEYSDYNFN